MYWILKTEPKAFSFNELRTKKTIVWDGVRNYQARNNLRQMNAGDLAMIYHSVTEKRIVGIAKVIDGAFKDPSTEGDQWLAVRIAYEESLTKPVSLAELKSDPRLRNLGLIKQSRLSVCPMTKNEWLAILELGQWPSN